MEHEGAELDGETFSCSICLNLLDEPVATPCGHNYCRKCIKNFWDEEEEYRIYSCPQCIKVFTSRPALLRNAELAASVEQLKNAGPRAAPADRCYAGPQDVSCDVCTGRKRKALQSCLVCLVSYCETHLQPHQDAALLKKHKLVEPSKRLRQNTCPRHDEVMEMFCRTDQQTICHLCSMDEHNGHDTVSAAEERSERQKELEETQQKIQQGIQEREEKLKVLLQEVEAIQSSADKTVEESEEIITQLIGLLEKRRSDLRQQVRSKQEAEVNRAKERRRKLEQEITELKRRNARVKWISDTADHKQFLHNFSSLSTEPTDSSGIEIRPVKYFSDVTEAVAVLQDKVQEVLMEKWAHVSWAVIDVDVLLSEPQPKTRADFLTHSCEITLDPNTAYRHIALSDGYRRAARIRPVQYPWSDPARFTNCDQVLSTQSLTGRCYWEVLWNVANYSVKIAVAYKDIKRDGYESGFGNNAKSWALDCCSGKVFHKGTETPVSGAILSKIGVYLDHSAGILSFYSVSQTMTLLHRVRTTFTEPLYAGLYVGYGSTAELCKLK